MNDRRLGPFRTPSKPRKPYAPRIECVDGTSLSVQASSAHYCTPRDDEGPYTHVEVGFVQDASGNGVPVPEFGDDDGVYAYVPIEIVEKFIESRGGRKNVVFETNAQGGMKERSGKRRWRLFKWFWKCVEEIVIVLEFGAKKYGDDNWKLVDPEDYREALQRHVSAYLSGETYDQESKRHHLAHAGCDLLFLMWFDLFQNEKK